MDELFDLPLPSEELWQALDARLERAWTIHDKALHAVSPEELESEFAQWDRDLEKISPALTDLLDGVADEVEAATAAGQPGDFGTLMACRIMEWARQRMEGETNVAQLGQDLQAFVCGWQFLLALEPGPNAPA